MPSINDPQKGAGFGPTKPAAKGFRGDREQTLYREGEEPDFQILKHTYSIPSPQFPRGEHALPTPFWNGTEPPQLPMPPWNAAPSSASSV